jgi:hypothetical protein
MGEKGFGGIEEANGGSHCLALWVMAFFYVLSHFNFTMFLFFHRACAVSYSARYGVSIERYSDACVSTEGGHTQGCHLL